MKRSTILNSPGGRLSPGSRRTSDDTSPGRIFWRRWVAVPVLVAVLAGCSRRSSAPKLFLALVADHGSRAVAVLNLGSLRVQKLISIGFAPDWLALRPHSREAFVLSDAGDVGVVEYRGLSVRARTRLPAQLTAFAFSPDGKQAYAAADSGRELFRVDCRTLSVSRLLRPPAPVSSLAVTLDGGTLLAREAGGTRLFFFSTAGRGILAQADVGRGDGPIVILPDGRKAFVAAGDAVVAVDLETRRALSSIGTGSMASFLALKPDGGELAVFSEHSSTLAILDTFHDDLEQTLTTGSRPAAAVFTRDSRTLFVANSGDGTVTKLDFNGRRVVGLTRAGLEPSALALTPDESFLLVADAGSDTVGMIRSSSDDLVTSVPIGEDPIAIAVPDWPATP